MGSLERIICVLLTAVLLAAMAGCGARERAAPGEGEPADPYEAAEAGVTREEPATEPDPPIEQPEEAAAVVPDWQFDTPENHGVDPELLEALHNAAAEAEEIRSIVVVKDGVIIDEYYQQGEYNAESTFRLASCSKSFSGALIGIAIEQGLIDGVDAKLSEYFPEIEQNDDSRWQEITLEHLLTHTSGIDWNEWNGGSMFGELARSENWVEFILERPMAAEPGTVFNYTTGGSHLLAAILQEAAGESAYDYAVENLFEPAGMDSAAWRSDPQGVTDGGNGISMTARDAAKFGQIYLSGGKWGDTQVIPRGWVEQSTAVQSAGTGGRTGQYGYQWWIRPFGEEAYDTFFAMGHGGQYIFVVPQLDLVTVLTSRYADTYAPWPFFTDYVLAACE